MRSIAIRRSSWRSCLVAGALSAPLLAGDGPAPLAPPPPELVRALDLSPLYVKHTTVHDLPIVGTARASDAALREAAYLIEQMIGHRPELLRALAAQRVRVVVMAPTELTTDVPEHADLAPPAYWDRRARGLGATVIRPAVSCGEENLLNLEGDPYATESTLVHELSHGLHDFALARLDRTFDERLERAFDAAHAAGRWTGTYAMENWREYWAEGAQSWFDTNRADDDEHGSIATRAALVDYDPPLAALLREVFGDRPWRYRELSDRDAAGRVHLAGFDRAAAPTFAWPKRVTDVPVLVLEAASPGPSRSSPTRTTIEIVNRRKQDLHVEWVDYDGRVVYYATLRPGTSWLQDTYVGHVWRVREGDEVLGHARAVATHARLEIE